VSQFVVGWKAEKLGNICDVVKIKHDGKPRPYLGMEHIESGTGQLISEPKKKVVKSSTFFFDSSNLLYGRLRPYLNKVYLPNFEGHCSSEIFPFLCNSDLDRRFLFYWFIKDSTVSKINETSTGARMPRANVKEILNFNFFLPPLPEQKQIVAILDKAFAGINQAITHTEQNLANAHELFESYLNDLSYEKQPLGNFVDISTGKLNANAAVENGEYPFFTCSREAYKIDKYAFDCEAVLLAGNNASGDFNVKHYNGKFNAYQRTYVINIKTNAEYLYRFLYFQLIKSLKELKRSSVGAGTKFLKIGMIKELMIISPPIKQQKIILTTLEGLLSKTENLETLYQQKLTALHELKQSLLQKAFAGELTR